MSDAVIYDISVLAGGNKIDQFVTCTDPSPDFELKWIERYKRSYPRIAKRYPDLTIHCQVRNVEQ